MINLSEHQSKFLDTEFGITIEQIDSMDKKAWIVVKEKCFDVVLDELLDENDEYNGDNEVSERCLLAESIMDIKFKDLKS